MRTIVLLSTFLIFGLPSVAIAASVLKAKGKTVLLNTQGLGEFVDVGSKVYAVVRGKQVSLIEIKKIKGERATGRIIAGDDVNPGTAVQMAELDATIAPDATGRAPASVATSSAGLSLDDPTPSSSKSKPLAVMIGITFDMETVKVPSSGSTKMSGTGYDIGLSQVFYEGSLDSVYRVGAQLYSADGASGQGYCNGTIRCISSLTYLMLDIFERAAINRESYLQAGLGAHIPLGTTTNFTQPKMNGLAPMIEGDYGMIFKPSPDIQIPVELGASYLMPGSGVTAIAFDVRAGVLF